MSIYYQLKTEILSLQDLTEYINQGGKLTDKLTINKKDTKVIEYEDKHKKIYKILINKETGDKLPSMYLKDTTCNDIINYKKKNIQQIIDLIDNKTKNIFFYKYYKDTIIEHYLFQTKYTPNQRLNIRYWFNTNLHDDMHQMIAMHVYSFSLIIRMFYFDPLFGMDHPGFFDLLERFYTQYYNIHKNNLFPEDYTKKICSNESEKHSCEWSNFLARLSLIRPYDRKEEKNEEKMDVPIVQ